MRKLMVLVVLLAVLMVGCGGGGRNNPGGNAGFELAWQVQTPEGGSESAMMLASKVQTGWIVRDKYYVTARPVGYQQDQLGAMGGVLTAVENGQEIMDRIVEYSYDPNLLLIEEGSDMDFGPNFRFVGGQATPGIATITGTLAGETDSVTVYIYDGVYLYSENFGINMDEPHQFRLLMEAGFSPDFYAKNGRFYVPNGCLFVGGNANPEGLSLILSVPGGEYSQTEINPSTQSGIFVAKTASGKYVKFYIVGLKGMIFKVADDDGSFEY